MSAFVATLQGGAPWGLRLQGGSGTGEPLRIAKINPGSKAARAQLHVGDIVETVNGVRTGDLPVSQAQKLLHNNSNDLQLKIYRSQLSVNGTYHPNGKMSSQSSLIVTNDSGFSGTAPNKDTSSGWRPIPFSAPPVPPPPGDVTDTEEAPKVPPKPKSVKTNIWLSANQPSQEQGSPTSPPMSPTNGFQMSPSKQKGVPPPPVMDIPTNNNNLRKDEDEFWPPPPPPDESKEWGPPPPPPPKPKPKHKSVAAPMPKPRATEAPPVIPPPPLSPPPPPLSPRQQSRPEVPNRKVIPPPRKFGFKPFKHYSPEEEIEEKPTQAGIWSPNEGRPSLDRVPDQMAPPPPLRKDEGIAPVWTPGGGPPVKKEFKPVKLDLANRPKISSVNPPTYSSPAAHTWSPSNQGVTSPNPITPQSNQPQYTQPMAVDTLPDPSHILSPGYVSPRSPSQQPHPPPPAQFAGDGPASPHPPVSRAVPVSPAGAVPYQPGGPVPYDGMSNGYGFLPASAVLSGSPGAIQSDLLTWGTQPGSALPTSTNDNSTIILDPSNLPPGALFQKQTIDGDVVHTDTFYPVQGVTRKTSTVVKHEAPNYDGIGPRDKDGLPLGLRQHVKEDNRHDWYKEMFKSIHKQDRDEDDSDDISLPPNVEDDWKREDRNNEPETVVKNTPSYRVQPGKIQNFVPGKSALAAHEKSVQAKKDGLLYYEGGRRGSAPGSGYASDDEARKGYHTFVKSGELPNTSGFGFGAPKARRASSNTKPVVQDSRYDYMSQFPTADRQINEKKPRQVREPDASYNKSLPEYLPIKSPSISDDRFDDFDFSPPVTVTATKQELTRASAIAIYPFTAQSKKELSFKKGDTIYLTREIDKNWVEGEHHGNKGIFPRTYVEIVTSIEEARNLQVNAPSAEGKGRAKYRFKGETANELSVNKGEIVDLVRKIDNNWWEVRHGNKAGIVPVAYLDVLREPQPGLSSPQPKSPLSSGGGRGPLSPSQAPRSPSTQAPRSPSTQAPRSPSAPADNLYQPNSPYLTDMPTLGRQQPSHQNRAGQGSRSGGGGGGSGGQRGMQPTGGRPAQNAGFHQKRPDGERFRAVYSYQPSNDDELEIMEGETVVVMEKCDDGWYVGFSEATGQFGTFPGNYVQRL